MQKITFSKKLSIKFKISRKQAESLIKSKKVTLNGDIEARPFLSVTDKDIFEIKKTKSSKLEQEELINQLFACSESSLCPEKKKIFHTIDLDYLKKIFK